MDGFVAESAKIVNSEYPPDIRLYRNAFLRDSVCKEGVSIGDDTTVERSTLGSHVVINRRSYINDSVIGDYSYTGINTTMNFTRMGKYCSVARNVDIGGFDHDYHKFTTMPMFRLRQMTGGQMPIPEHNEYCEIGSDVWIAAGAQVLHKVRIGDGAVVGGGAVVVKDVPPYAIVAGVPAKIIKYRFDDSIISELMEIRWWDWPQDILKDHLEWMISTDVNHETINRLKEIQRSFN